ncbi:CU044_5270 family protein [Streptomyces lichenis]|uniref:CU044_5270 family protein n=1 Tax=Streptomyces lichenis TaxID=2306967 RepID=A0ABT0ICI4_9ACTN|nr:CU044_5270 family protein [Streptomyces lichenis]MCK8679033.1 CU044_5270 family protein [Streptomyces lichenis]
MNDTPDSFEIKELARLLPEPIAPDLPQRAHDLHKERLMRLIDQDQRNATAPAPARRPVLRRPAVLLPAAGLAVAGALAAVLALGPAPTGPGTLEAKAATGTPAAELVLDRASTVALAMDAEPVGENDFVYVRGMVRAADLTSGKPVLEPLHQWEAWFPQRPGKVRKIGYTRENGEITQLNGEVEAQAAGGTAPGFDRPTYRWLAELPNDPEELLKRLRELPRVQRSEDRDQAVFEEIGALVCAKLMPPETAAMLYRATALIPGVRSAPDATDATGRHGIGIVRDSRNGERTEWVFDKDYTLLGSRTYLVRDTPMGPKGTLLDAIAIQERGVVGKVGDRPN